MTGAHFNYGPALNFDCKGSIGDYYEFVDFTPKNKKGVEAGSAPAGSYSFWGEYGCLGGKGPKIVPNDWTIEVTDEGYDFITQRYLGPELETFSYIRPVGPYQNSCSTTKGSLPGCRFFAHKTEKWTLPDVYRSEKLSSADVEREVCSTVAIPPTEFFESTDVNTKLWILGDGDKGRIRCDNSDVTYCVTGNWNIVKCRDLRCQYRSYNYFTYW